MNKKFLPVAVIIFIAVSTVVGPISVVINHSSAKTVDEVQKVIIDSNIEVSSVLQKQEVLIVTTSNTPAEDPIYIPEWTDLNNSETRTIDLLVVSQEESRLEREPDTIETWGCITTVPSAGLGLNSFYKKVCVVKGIPIISAAAVPDAAFIQVTAIIKGMLAARPDILDQLVIHNIKVAILGTSDTTTDLPEYSFLKNDSQTDWDARARGLGATIAVPLASGAEENLLCLVTDPYKGESIFLHEFAHSIMGLGIAFLDPSFPIRLETAYNSAIQKGLWKDTYAATNQEEYWAEGVQGFFDANLSASPADGIHNFVDTREELENYDPMLYSLIEETFSTEWRWKCDL